MVLISLNSHFASGYFEVDSQKEPSVVPLAGYFLHDNTPPRRDYSLCEGYTIEYVSERPDERRFYIDPDKYRNPKVRKALELPEGGVGVFYPGK